MEFLLNFEFWCIFNNNKNVMIDCVLNFENIFLVYLIVKVLLFFGKGIMKLIDKETYFIDNRI